MFCNLRGRVCETNFKDRCIFKGDWNEINDISEKSVGLAILIGVYKSKTENVLQVWSTEDSHPLPKCDIKVLKYIAFWRFKCKKNQKEY